MAIYQWRATVNRRAAQELYHEAYVNGFVLNAVMPPASICYRKPAGNEGFADGKAALDQIYPINVAPFSYKPEARARAIIPLAENANHIRPECKNEILAALKTWTETKTNTTTDNKTLDRSGD